MKEIIIMIGLFIGSLLGMENYVKSRKHESIEGAVVRLHEQVASKALYVSKK